MKNYIHYKEASLLPIILLLSVFILFNIHFIYVANATIYPYNPDIITTNGISLPICKISGDSAINKARLCIPKASYLSGNISGLCTRAGFEQVTIKVGDEFYCLPSPGLETGLAGLTCPAGSDPIYEKAGIWTLITTGESAIATNCLSRKVLQKDCPKESQITNNGAYEGCTANPTSMTGIGGVTVGASSCDTAYKPGTNGGKIGVNAGCKTGDYVTTCPGKGNLCVAPLVAGGEKITQQLHEYQTKYTLPCQPLAGGQCASDQTPAGYIARLYQFGLMIVGLFAFGGIVYGALKYILSAGSMADQSDAKDQITQAVLGLVLLLGSFLILYTINPEITNLRNPNLEVIQIKNIIKAGEANNSGEQKIPTGGAGSSDSLCKLAVNSQISLNVGADLSDSGSGTLFDLSGTQLPSGNQSVSKCISCKDNASLGSDGVCSCNSDSLNYDGGCVLTSKCLSEIGTVGGPGGTTCVERQNCKLPGFTRNLTLGGICTQTSTREDGCPAGSTFVSSSAQPEIEPAFEKGYCQEQ